MTKQFWMVFRETLENISLGDVIIIPRASPTEKIIYRYLRNIFSKVSLEIIQHLYNLYYYDLINCELFSTNCRWSDKSVARMASLSKCMTIL